MFVKFIISFLKLNIRFIKKRIPYNFECVDNAWFSVQPLFPTIHSRQCHLVLMGQTLITALNRVANILCGFVLMPCQVRLSRTESPLNAFKRNVTQ